MANMVNFKSGRPGQPIDMVRKQPNVRIYFIGTQLMNKKEDGTFTSPILSAGGHGAMQMPPIGEYLEVAQNVADILVIQSTTYTRKGEKVPGFTTDKTYADLVRASFEKQIPLEQVVAEKASVNLTDEQLMALIQTRPSVAKKLGLEVAEEAVEEKEEDAPAVPKNKPGRPAAVKKDE